MARIFPSREDFRAKCAEGNLIPVYREMIADCETPVSAFRKIADSPHAFLLESVEGGEKLGRYSFLGANPFAVFRSKGDEVEINYSSGRRESFRDPNPLDRLRDMMREYKPVRDPSLPPFVGGAVGYVGYDAIRTFEPTVGELHNDDLDVPDFYFMITDSLLVFDHVRHRLRLLVNAHITEGANLDEAYDDALRRIAALYQRVARPAPFLEQTVSFRTPSLTSNMSQDQYRDMVGKAKEFIAAGDAFQIVLSQRFKVQISAEPFDVYRALRAVNPSPYMFYLQFEKLKLAGSSPEVHVKLTGREVQLRPIAGTRPRGADENEDVALEKELLADPKERAEHIMLVDLGRNDCGRVCDYGTVRVDDLMTIERYSHVMHIVSNVRGKLKPELDAFDVFKATFPAGTVSGAPKVRAMQIINDLEPTARATYAGAVGYFSFDGNLDCCITIRTCLIKDDTAYVQAGGGIVADSDPAMEFRETVNKAGAVVKAIEMAESGLE